ncbi:hypothetical protein [Chryseobacterium balustinum]|uniref:Uncharacterized protein n=1 Tax=Chryseobacterium balustinum TaxID=246 RepID=A0AAX2INQ2_9FLAO|nr:hypothetical protein [Chryseobacterium balustinum]AZB29184.1 hypothetical protein EB354_07925 [Chryseobacterium balustinum]SKB69133.1 hypothetical protein SAMN05421800_10672 [Chryseobacterium balustinum]SQA91550.1 Uncharacterised protein [Chryseobacterium balustinum]
MSNELKIKIIKDSQGNDLDLSNITVEAADALKVFIDSMVDFAKTYENTSEIKLMLDNGCIETSLVYPDELVSQDIDNILSLKVSDPKKVDAFKKIQEKIILNGLEYGVFIKKQDEAYQDITNIFKEQKFRKSKKKFDRKYTIEFIEGELFEVGGRSKVNVHIENKELGKEYKVECERPEAKKLNDRLYSKTFISVRKIIKTESDFEYRYIDSYLREESYHFYRNLHEQLTIGESIEKYDLIYNHIVEIINNENIPNEEIIKIIRLYDNHFSEKGILRTIIMSLKPIIERETGLLPYYENLVKTFRLRSNTGKI